jgi:hypothetical protein
MSRAYKILYFNRAFAQIGVQFEGRECFNFPAPHKDGAYLTGQALEDAIQALYPYTADEWLALAPTLTGGEELEAKVEVLADIPSAPDTPEA